MPIGIGPPFYEPFEVLTMDPSEMAAEKLRALAQRIRATDLADLAVLLSNPTVSNDKVARFAKTDVIPGLFPGAPDYASALKIVMPRIMDIVPSMA